MRTPCIRPLWRAGTVALAMTLVALALGPLATAQGRTVRGTQPRGGRLGPTPPQTLTSQSGHTTVELPTQVVSGSRLPVLVRSVPGSMLTLTITFADNSQIVRGRRVPPSGSAVIDPLITYQPQSIQETATVTVQVVGRMRPAASSGTQAQSFVDTVHANVTVVQHIRLAGRLIIPHAAAPGSQLPVTVISNMPNVAVSFVLTYPDRQTQTVAPPGATTNASDTYSTNLAISASDGTRGILYVQAVLSYGGIERRIPAAPARVFLSGAKAKSGARSAT